MPGECGRVVIWSISSLSLAFEDSPFRDVLWLFVIFSSFDVCEVNFLFGEPSFYKENKEILSAYFAFNLNFFHLIVIKIIILKRRDFPFLVLKVWFDQYKPTCVLSSNIPSPELMFRQCKEQQKTKRKTLLKLVIFLRLEKMDDFVITLKRNLVPSR